MQIMQEQLSAPPAHHFRVLLTRCTYIPVGKKPVLAGTGFGIQSLFAAARGRLLSTSPL
jgi:hypothetical protein